jgi:hypothetical protein
MSDVTVADSGAPAAVHEVPINEAPVSTPNPISNEAPEKSVAEARRESIQKAYDKAVNPQPKIERPKSEAKPAEAKPGHNNPPEETPKIDLKKRPADQPRGDRGQFAPRDQSNGQVASHSVTNAQGEPRQPAKRLPEGTPHRDPPARFSEAGKADWATTPENVRGDIHRMHQEYAKAYEYYRADHEAMKPIRQYHQMAQQHGTTLDRALNNYVSMEHKLRADPIGGLDVIVNNLNLRTPDGQKIGLRDIAYHVLSQSPEQLKVMQQGNAQSAASQQIGALHQEISTLKTHLQQMHTQQQFVYTRSAVDQFADQHPRFDELGDLIEAELKTGYDLPTAYRRAELLRPATHAAQTRTASAQTRPADKSIHGAPDVAPSNGASRPKKPVSRREALERAMSANGVA